MDYSNELMETFIHSNFAFFLWVRVRVAGEWNDDKVNETQQGPWLQHATAMLFMQTNPFKSFESVNVPCPPNKNPTSHMTYESMDTELHKHNSTCNKIEF